MINSLNYIPNVSATEYSVARIVSIDCPKKVEPFEIFQITVKVEYQESAYVDIGISDVKKDEFVQSLTSINEYFGPGEEIFIFNLTAPKEEGIWNLEATTRAWWRNAWFGDPIQGHMEFDVEIKKSVKKEIELFANHTIPISSNTRLRFSGWSDGIESNPRNIRSNIKDITSPIYKKQFFLEISSQIDLIKGEGWYDEGSIAKIEAPSQAYIEGEKYRFSGWKGDIDSEKTSTEVQMNEGKIVQATWISEGSKSSMIDTIYLISFSFLASSFIIGIFFVMKKWKKKVPIMCMIILLFISFFIPSIQANPDNDTRYKKLEISDTTWRYWENSGSDTCLIWLGGGIFTQQLFINPYSLESYNTMHFLQDLTRFYSVLAIEEGSKELFRAAFKSNIYGEIYEGSTFIEKARIWLMESGYSQVYMVGYSVGGVAAARESIREHPGRWKSPNGMILITTPKDKTVWNNADKLQGNLLLLYGEKMTKSFIEAGEELLDQTPDEGHINKGWIHKEIIVFPEVAHEVWTGAENGIYNPEAVEKIVGFIEKSKMLHYLNNESKIGNLEPKSEKISVEIFVEPCLTLKEPMRLRVKIEGLKPANYTFVAEPLIEDVDTSIFHTNFYESKKEILLIFTQVPNGEFKFRLFAYSSTIKNLGIFEASWKKPILIRVMNGFEFPIFIDGIEYKIGRDGELSIEIPIGEHDIEVPQKIELASNSRLYFKEWDNCSNSTKISIELTGNIELYARYIRQFLVEGHSTISKIEGNRWYDENSTAFLTMSPKIIEREKNIFVFHGWNSNGEIIGEQIYVTKPMNVQAHWQSVNIPSSKKILSFEFIISFIFLSLSFAIFLVVTIFAKKNIK